MSGVHPSLFRSQIDCLLELGHEIVVPKESNFFGYGDTMVHLGYLPVEMRSKLQPAAEPELSELGITLVWGGSWEQLNAARRLTERLSCPLIVYACCNDVPYSSDHAQYLLSEDLITFVKSTVPNKRFVVFPTDYSLFSPALQDPDNLIATLINNYENEWPTQFAQYEAVVREFSKDWQFVRGRGLAMPDVARLLRRSAALLHIKAKEASGHAMMEALAAGCPVIVNASLLAGRTCALFLEPGYNSWLLREDKLLDSFAAALGNLPRLRMNAASSIRQSVRKERTLRVLDEILGIIRQ